VQFKLRIQNALVEFHIAQQHEKYRFSSNELPENQE